MWPLYVYLCGLPIIGVFLSALWHDEYEGMFNAGVVTLIWPLSMWFVLGKYLGPWLREYKEDRQAQLYEKRRKQIAVEEETKRLLEAEGVSYP